MASPALERSVEIDVEHHATEIEQQRIGCTGGEGRWDHGGGLRKSKRASNRIRIGVNRSFFGVKPYTM
jgi:hypothetical protein